MKTPRRVIRRAFAIAGAALAGAAIALAIPAAAQAHSQRYDYTVGCDSDTGQWKVTWTITNDWRQDAIVTSVTANPAGTSLTGVANGSVIPKSGTGSLVGIQMVPGTATSANITLKVKWPDNYSRTLTSQTVTFKDTCTVPAAVPTVSFAATCDDLVATLVNKVNARSATTFHISNHDGYNQDVSVPVNDQVDVTIPAANAAHIWVTVGASEIGKTDWKKPAGCDPPVTDVSFNCADTAVTVTNPIDGKTVTVTITPSEPAGSAIGAAAAESFTLNPGNNLVKTYKSSPGSSLLIHVPGQADQTANWQKPLDCLVNTPTPPPSQPTEPELPTTGAGLTLPVSIGAAFVAIGGVILFVVRRRRGAHARF